jgi:hypothetical protein
VAQEWVLRFFSHACDGGTGCHQEAWYNHDKAQKAYEEAKKAVELVEAGLAMLDGTSTGSRKNHKKKALAKAKEAAK